jgi:hypothetical protein
MPGIGLAPALELESLLFGKPFIALSQPGRGNRVYVMFMLGSEK